MSEPVIGYQLKLGTVDGMGHLVRSVSVTSDADLLDVLNVRLEVPTGPDSVSLLLACKPGVPCAAKIGKRSFVGDLVRVAARVVGSRTDVTLVALEPLHRLRHVRVAQSVVDTQENVLKTIAGLVGAKLEVPAGGTKRPNVTWSDSALKAVREIAALNNYALAYDGTTLKLTARDAPRPSADVTVDWLRDVAEFNLVLNVDAVATAVTVGCLDENRAELKHQAAAPTGLAKISGGTLGTDLRKTIGPLEIFVQELPESLTPPLAKERAERHLAARAEQFLTGRAVVTGNYPLVTLGSVRFEGAPWPFNGPFRLKAVESGVSTGDGPPSTVVEFFSDSLPKEA